MRQITYARSFEVARDLAEHLIPLRDLAYNLRWTWHPETQALFRDLDPQLWEETEHNPIRTLHLLTEARQQELEADSVFLDRASSMRKSLDRYLQEETWFQKEHGESKEHRYAYFCAEFGLHECLPMYSGGLGVLAGDHLKSASDLGLPLVAVGLLYSRGYFRQSLSRDGWQQERYERYDFSQMPLQLVRGEHDEPLRIRVDLPDRAVSCQIWRADVGRVPLYLLDSNILENRPDDQGITDTLYGGDEEMRIRQEMVLGLGGVRALNALGIEPTSYHLNEGHSAFLTLERIRHLCKEGVSFRIAQKVTRASSLFTTHTPVPAGFDIFPTEMADRHIGGMAEELGISRPELLNLGKMRGEEDRDRFNMAVLAMNGANRINGVSLLHAEVSRQMFGAQWPDFPGITSPLAGITNGIHTASWVGPEMAALLDRHIGRTWRRDPSDPGIWAKASEFDAESLWTLRQRARGAFLRFCQSRVDGVSLDPAALTIGFARRFATYKRANLMLGEPDRLAALLSDEDRPVQIIFAGKAHPKDEAGKRMIQEVVQFAQDRGLKHRMVFLPDYDLMTGRQMVQGVDLWLNNPRRPMEASGTSGMKVVPNGGLNCSVLDGWWAEAYSPEVGWAIGKAEVHPDQGHQDWLDSQALFECLEDEVIPTFYDRSGEQPVAWIQKIKASMRTLAPHFSTHRMVRQYTNRGYLPASRDGEALAADNHKKAEGALEWADRVGGAWPGVRINQVRDNGEDVRRSGDTLKVSVQADLNGLGPHDVLCEAFIGQVGQNRGLLDPEVHELSPTLEEGGFSAEITCQQSGHLGLTVRLTPRHPLVAVPQELPLSRWQDGLS